MEEPNCRNFHTGVEIPVWNTMMKFIIYIKLLMKYLFFKT